MTEKPQPQPQEKNGFLERVTSVFNREPQTREELLEVLSHAEKHHLFDADVLCMMQGALQFSELTVADLMVPRAQMEVVDISEPRKVWLPKMIARGHSRFPVVDDDIDHVKGIVHAKDLLHMLVNPSYDVLGHLRPARFVPETQPLNVLMHDFQITRNHLALAVDEFGAVSGLITLEDVVEQIVGNIDDEFDPVNLEKDNITTVDEAHWRVKSQTQLTQFNEFFGVNLVDDYCETVGGMVTDRFEHVPHKGEAIEIEGFRFKVVKGDERQATLFIVERLVAASTSPQVEKEGD